MLFRLFEIGHTHRVWPIVPMTNEMNCRQFHVIFATSDRIIIVQIALVLNVVHMYVIHRISFNFVVACVCII